MFGWSDREATAKHAHTLVGVGEVYQIGRYSVTVREDGAVTYRAEKRSYGDPRRTLPNMEIVDGQITISLSDLVETLLERVSPAELAEALFSDPEVRATFIEQLGEHAYNSHFTESDRRALLHTVKERVHSEALDKLGEEFGRREYEAGLRTLTETRVYEHNRALSRIEDALRQRLGEPTFDLPRVPLPGRDAETNIGGTLWNEARAFWREELLRRFPPPEALAPADEPAGGLL